MKAKTYKAAVTNKETGKLEVITRDDYTSKKDFAHDLRVNGYAVRFISTPEKFDEDCEKYHWELERRKNVREAMKQHKASKEQDEQEVQETVEQTETKTNETTVQETVKKTERKINMKKSYNEMTIEELNKEHIRLINWADEAETDRQAKSRLKKVSEFETYYKARVEELRATQATNETTVQETVEQAAEQETAETVEGISKTETTTEADDSGFEYTRSQAQEIIMAGTSIAREKYREKHNIHSPMDLKKFSKKQLDDYLSKELDY